MTRKRAIANLRRTPERLRAYVAKSQITYAVPIMAMAGCSKRNRSRKWLVVEKSERIEPLSEVAGNRVSPRAASAPLTPNEYGGYQADNNPSNLLSVKVASSRGISQPTGREGDGANQ